MGTSATDGAVILTLEFERDGKYWLGHCRELGTATDGRSLEKVKRDLVKLVTLHLNGLLAIDELDNLFRERGIKLYTDSLPAEVTAHVPVSDHDRFVQATPIHITSPDRLAVAS